MNAEGGTRTLRPRVLIAILLLIPALGCAAFRYERTSGQAPPGAPRTNLKIGVVEFSAPPAAGFYPIRFGNTLADPIGDLSRAVAAELREAGLFADVIYLGGPPPDAAARDYYREVYGLDGILSGEVTSFYVTSAPEPWSLLPPLLALWPLHVLGLPTAPCHDRVALHGTLVLEGLAPGTGGWRTSEQRLSWHEHNWYSAWRIPAIERALQIRALDHIVTSLVATLAAELAPARLEALLLRPAVRSPSAR